MKATFLLTVAMLVIGGLFLAGCEKDKDKNNPTPTAANVSGTWNGTYSLGGAGTVPVVVNLGQNGNNVSGTASWGGRSASDVSGQINGNDIALTFDYQTSGWASDVVAGQVNGNTMVLNGSDGDYDVSYNLTRAAAGVIIVGDDPSSLEALKNEAAIRNKTR